jgi:hypothetical protein
MELRQRLRVAAAAVAVVMIVVGVAAFVIDSGVSGAGPSTDWQNRTPPPEGDSVLVPTPKGSASLWSGQPETPGAKSPSPSPKLSPTPRPAGFAVSGSSIVYYTGDGTIVPVPSIDGLRTALVGGKVIYSALAGNPYNLKIGSYAGEFRPNVTMQQTDGSTAQTGGIAAVGPVVSRLISDRLADLSESSERWVVALPVDIRSSNDRVDVTFDSFGLHGWSDTPRVAVRFVGQLPVVNAIPDNSGFHVLVEHLGVTAWQVIDPLRLALSQTELDPEHLMNQLLIYGNGTASTGRDILVDEHVDVGRVMLTAADEVSVSLVVRTSRADLGPDRVLQVGDVPVFVASS